MGVWKERKKERKIRDDEKEGGNEDYFAAAWLLLPPMLHAKIPNTQTLPNLVTRTWETATSCACAS